MLEHNLTAEQIKDTEAFKNASDVLQVIWVHPAYVKAMGGYLRLVELKGLDFTLGMYHMTDFKRKLLKELHKKTEK